MEHLLRWKSSFTLAKRSSISFLIECHTISKLSLSGLVSKEFISFQATQATSIFIFSILVSSVKIDHSNLYAIEVIYYIFIIGEILKKESGNARRKNSNNTRLTNCVFV